MKKLIALIFFICFVSCISFAQEIQKSSQTEFIGGKDCYLHTVKAGQTLFAIVKAYEVSEDEIYQMNPDARKGIKVNMVLKIPVKTPANKDVYILHTVVQGETLSKIAEHYHVNINDIYKINTGLTSKIKPGQKIKIPKKEKIHETPAKGNYQMYYVQKGESLFGIARKYNVTVDDLKKANPGLNETLRVGQQIKIPVQNAALPTTDKVKDTANFECMKTGMLNSYNVGLLVPFYLNKTLIIDSANIDNDSKKFDSFTFIGFYEGFLIALDSLEKSGVSVKVMVDDAPEDTNILDILRKPAYSSLNLLIGPFFSRSFGVAAGWAKEKQVKIVNPFSSHSEFINGNPYVFKNVTSCAEQSVQSISYIKKTWPACNIFLVHAGKDCDSALLSEYKKELDANGKINKDYFVVDYAKEGLEGVSKHMSVDKPNVIVSLIQSETSISNYIRGLSDLSFTYPLVVFGTKQWEDYSSLEIPYLMNIRLHILSNSFIDYQKSDIKSFVRKYRERYHTEPDAYAFAGFDNAMYYLNALHLYGSGFQNCLNKYHPRLLQTDMDFDHNDGNGYENKKICIYRYENFKMIDAYANPLTSVEINKKDK